MTDATKYCLGCMEESGGIAVCPHCGYPQDRKPDSVLHLTPGLILHNRYLAGRVLGDGGFGITYIGRDLTLDSKVAIKEYFPSGVAVRTTGSPDVFPASSGFRQDYQWGLDRFLDEARLVRKFKDHPNIVRVEDFFAENSTAYMILEFLDGITLEKYLERKGGRIEFQPALNCMVWVMDALREVHAAGVLHRDISPDNIFLVRSGHVKLIDFGAARQAMGQKSMNLSVILKRGYAPAEQYETNGQQGPWTDVYATAGTLYRAITGSVPPPAPDRMNRDILVPPSGLGAAIPPAQEQALVRALALRVEDRYPDMLSFENAMLGRAGSGPPPPPPPPAPQPKFPLWLVGIGALALAIFVALAVALWSAPKPPVVKSFRAEPTQVKRGASATLTWQVENVDKVEIEGIGEKPPSGSLPVAPQNSTVYALIAKGKKKGVEVRQAVQITVEAPAAARIAKFEANPQTIKPGDPAILAWQVEGAREVSIGGQAVKPVDSAEVRPKESTSYTLSATGEDGAPQTAQVVVTVERPNAPPAAQIEITMLAFEPPVIQAGQSTTLRWQSRGATRASIEGLGAVETNGSRTLRPARSGWAKLTVTGPGGSATSTANVVVNPAQGGPDPNPNPAGPRVTAFRIEPAQLAPGQSAQMSWSVTGSTRVVISPEPGNVAASGMTSIQPRRTNRYVLTAWDAQGREATATAMVTVGASSTPPVETGQAWSVAHDHDGNVKPFNPYDRNWDHCEGVLRLANGRLRFDTRFAGDSFDVPVSEVREVKTNRLNIAGMRAFHVKLATGRNFNFVPRQSPDLIVAAIQRAQ